MTTRNGETENPANDPLELERIDKELRELYGQMIARRVMALNERDRLRVLGLLGEMERLSARPIPDAILEIRE